MLARAGLTLCSLSLCTPLSLPFAASGFQELTQIAGAWKLCASPSLASSQSGTASPPMSAIYSCLREPVMVLRYLKGSARGHAAAAIILPATYHCMCHVLNVVRPVAPLSDTSELVRLPFNCIFWTVHLSYAVAGLYTSHL